MVPIEGERLVGEPPDAALWLEATSGTESSFGILFHRHRARVFRKAYARVGNVAEAEDIVAMVFLEAWRSRAKVRIVDGSILPWLLVTTTNVTLNAERAKRRYRRMLSALPPGVDQRDHADDVAHALDLRQYSGRLTAALKRLNSTDRIIVDMCMIDEQPISMAAAVLDLPVGTAKSRLHRARAKLRGYFLEAPALPSRNDAIDAVPLTEGGPA